MPVFVAFFTAIAVDAVADAVQEGVRLALDFDFREILQVFVDADGGVARFAVQILPEVVAAACGEVINIVPDVQPGGIVDEAVQRAVAAAD